MNTAQALILTYLLNSLWQVPLVFAAAWLASRIARSSGPAVEHSIWVAALLAETLLPARPTPSRAAIDTLLRCLPWNLLSGAARADAHITILAGPGFASRSSHVSPHLLSAVAAVYLFATAYFAARLLWSLTRTRAMQRNAAPFHLTGAAAITWARCCNHFHLCNVRVAASLHTASPVTIGIRHRLLLLPVALPSELLAEDLNAALAHECAHMHRNDFAKNLAYAALTLPIAYHPLLWLTRSRLEQSREMVCDTMAADALDGSHRFARSLLRLAAIFAQRPPDKTLHAIGIFDANIFERRVMNLTQNPTQPRLARRLATLAACLAIACGTCASALALHMNVAPSDSLSQESTSAQVDSAQYVSAKVIAGTRLSFVQPIYPKEAKAAGIQGKVVLSATIGKDGQIASLKVLSGPPELTKAAWAAVKQWTYAPFMHNGQPTEVDTTITVNFSLDTNGSAAPDHASPGVGQSASGATRPALIHQGTGPIFPPAEKNKGAFDGTVVVALTVNTDGLPTNVSVKKSLGSDFDQSALEAVKQYRFKPATLAGNPVSSNLYIDVKFQKF
ncbi:MAG: M56 family metallopeptidase [Acidobacteria bacterium]|nr:M56 family metallopeptidase [Acidobacteriota bacterium]